MIIWKGWGILALIIPLICSWIANFVFDSTYGEGFYQNSTWAMPFIIALTSLPIGIIGYKLNNRTGRILIDPDNNKKVEIKTVNTMFWIPLQYWAFIILGICALMYAVNIGLILKQ